jgi:hypothetical protein
MEITSLPAYPIDKAIDKPGEKTHLRLKETLEKRGEKYFNIVKKGSMQANYRGESLDAKKHWVSQDLA